MRKKLFYFFIFFIIANFLIVGFLFIPDLRINNYLYKEEMIVNELTTKYNFTNEDLKFIKKQNLDTNDIVTLDVIEDENFYPIEGIDIETLYFKSSKYAMIKCEIPIGKFNHFRYHLALLDDTALLYNYITIDSSIRYRGQEYVLGSFAGNEESHISNMKLKLLNCNLEYSSNAYDIKVNISIKINLGVLDYDKHPILNFSIYEERDKINDGLYLGYVHIGPKNKSEITKISKMSTFIQLGGE